MNQRNLLVVAHSYSNFIKDQVEALSPFFKGIYVFVRLNPFAEISNYLPIHRLKKFTQSSRIDLHKKPLNIHVIPTPIIYLPFNFNFKNIGEQHFKAVDRIIKKEKISFDLIHAHFTWSAGYVGTRLKEQYNVPLVLTAHGFDIYSLPFRDLIWKQKIQSILNKTDIIITVSQKNLEFVKKLGVSTPIYVISNGFRKDLFSPKNTFECRKLLNLPIDKKILLTVGYLDPIKGQKYLIDSIFDIVKKRKDLLCIIVGIGGEKRHLESKIKTLGLEDYIILTGEKPHDEIPVWMNACDLFILPSLNEGNPTVMFEALGCGKPFVGTKVGGIPEIISSEEYGLLVEPANPEDLTKKILVALDCHWDQDAILKYAEQFTWETIVKDKIMKLYEQVVG